VEANTHRSTWWFWGEGWSRFGAFGVVGGALILLAHAVLPHARWPIAIFALLLMAAFGYSEWGYKKGQEDRLGDDLYYLGLTYTLISVAHALYASASAADVDWLVSNFSVALLTTLAGIVGRVLLYEKHASQKQPVQIDAGMAQLRAEIEGAIDQMRQFRRGVAMSIQQAADSALKSVDNAFASFTTSANQMSEAAKGMNASLRKTAGAFDRSFARIGEASQTLAGFVSELVARTSLLRSVTDAVHGPLNELIEGTKALGGALQALGGQMDSLNALLDQQRRAVEASIDAQGEITRHIRTDLASLNRPLSLLAGSLDEIRQKIDAVNHDINGVHLGNSLAQAREAADTLTGNLRYVASTVSPASTEGYFSVLKAFGSTITELTANVSAQHEVIRECADKFESLNRPVSLLTLSIDEMRQQIDAAMERFTSAQLSMSLADIRDAAETLSRNLRDVAGAISPGYIENNISTLKAFGDTVIDLSAKVNESMRKLTILVERPVQASQRQNQSIATADNEAPGDQSTSGAASDPGADERYRLDGVQSEGGIAKPATSYGSESNDSSTHDAIRSENVDNADKSRGRSWWPWGRN
jgi:Mg2+ and Co2+ transporter CorA